MTRAWVIAGVTLRDLVQRKILFLPLGGIALISLLFHRALRMVFEAQRAKELEIAEQVAASIVQSSVWLWVLFANVVGLVIAAQSRSLDARHGALELILARPVSPAEYALGKWLAIQGALAVVVAIGFCFIGWLWLTGGYPAWPLAIGLAGAFVQVVAMTTVALALGLVFSPVVGGTVAFLLVLGPQFVGVPDAEANLLVRAFYFMGRAVSRHSPLTDVFSLERLDGGYAGHALIVTENLLYALAIYLVGVEFFRRREITG